MKVDKNNPMYVGIPIDKDGTKIFIEKNYVLCIINEVKKNNRIFYLDEPKLISHTTTYQNALTNYPNYVSTNHCQFGSAISVYEVKKII
jgi:hypothetical protein